MSERIYVCVVCGHTLSEADWLSLPDSVNCPECGVSKDDYVLMEGEQIVIEHQVRCALYNPEAGTMPFRVGTFITRLIGEIYD